MDILVIAHNNNACKATVCALEGLGALQSQSSCFDWFVVTTVTPHHDHKGVKASMVHSISSNNCNPYKLTESILTGKSMRPAWTPM